MDKQGTHVLLLRYNVLIQRDYLHLRLHRRNDDFRTFGLSLKRQIGFHTPNVLKWQFNFFSPSVPRHCATIAHTNTLDSTLSTYVGIGRYFGHVLKTGRQYIRQNTFYLQMTKSLFFRCRDNFVDQTCRPSSRITIHNAHEIGYFLSNWDRTT